MMKRFLATASLAALLLVSFEGHGGVKAGTIGTVGPVTTECKFPKAEEYLKANAPDLVLETKADQQLFYKAYFGKDAPRTYDKVMFYPTKGGNPIVEVVLVNDGCIVHVGKISKAKYFIAKRDYKGKPV